MAGRVNVRWFQSHWVALCLLLAVGVCCGAQAGRPPRPQVVEVLMHDTIQNVSAESLRSNLQAANRLHPAAILLNLSTPGGLPESAKAMVEAIERSPAPVIVYVRDPGTHVGGQGLRLWMAADVRAMHPDTLLLPLRERSRWENAARKQSEEDTLREQLAETLRARGRDTEVIDDTLAMLFAGTAPITSDHALQAGLVNAIAGNEDRLMTALNGTRITRNDGSTTTLSLGNAHVSIVQLDLREHLVRAMMNPDLTVLLLTLGGLLIYLEINTPGGVIPGAAGVLLVMLALYAFAHMPLRWEGVLLLAISTTLLMAEAVFHRGSMLAWFAIFALVLGLRLLVRGPIPELEVDWSTALGAGIGFGGITAGLLLLAAKARRAKITTGADAMLGWMAVAHTELAPEGQVLVRGELWHARLSGNDGFLRAGECVKVESAEGRTLQVAAMPSVGNA